MKVLACTYDLHITVKHHVGAQGQSHMFLTASVYVNQSVSKVLVGLCNLRQSHIYIGFVTCQQQHFRSVWPSCVRS